MFSYAVRGSSPDRNPELHKNLCSLHGLLPGSSEDAGWPHRCWNDRQRQAHRFHLPVPYRHAHTTDLRRHDTPSGWLLFYIFCTCWKYIPGHSWTASPDTWFLQSRQHLPQRHLHILFHLHGSLHHTGTQSSGTVPVFYVRLFPVRPYGLSAEILRSFFQIFPFPVPVSQ